MQRRQQVGCGLITLRDGRGWVALDKALDAEILGDQESGVEVGARSECLFIGVERKSSAHGQSDENGPEADIANKRYAGWAPYSCQSELVSCPY